MHSYQCKRTSSPHCGDEGDVAKNLEDIKGCVVQEATGILEL